MAYVGIRSLAREGPSCGRRFVVEILVRNELPEERLGEIPDLDAQIVRERSVVVALVAAGRVLNIWREVGANAVWSVWSVESLAQLEEFIRLLPLAPWSVFEVRELAEHPVAALVRGDVPADRVTTTPA
jgi:muconolactone delta-isomerase